VKALFLMSEEYAEMNQSHTNFELRLPIINSGMVTEYMDIPYQRLLRNIGRDAMNQHIINKAIEYKPDIIINSTTWRHENIDISTLDTLKSHGIPVYTHIWDSLVKPDPYEISWFLCSSAVGVADSLARFLYYDKLNEDNKLRKKVFFTSGNTVFTDIFRDMHMPKKYEVTLLGSNEGQRVHFNNYLKDKLKSDGIDYHKLGGLVDSTKGDSTLGRTDKWIPIEDYVKTINQSKICLCSPTDPLRYQIKGKVFEFLACGTLCFSEYNSEIKKIIPDGCIVYYDSFEDCAEKIKYYISNEKEREKISRNGYEWFHGTFSYKRFWSQVISSIIESN